MSDFEPDAAEDGEDGRPRIGDTMVVGAEDGLLHSGDRRTGAVGYTSPSQVV